MQHKLISKLKSFQKLLSRMKEMTILVEGKRDKKALELAGIGKEIIMLNSRKMELLASQLSGKRVVVLTDYDRTGERLAREAHEELLSHGAYPDIGSRQKLKRILGLYRIEEINTSIRDFEEKLDMIRNRK